MHISIILGTGREGRQSEKVSATLFSMLHSNKDIESELVDVREVLTGKSTIRYNEETGKEYAWYLAAKRSDGFIFVLPEYNHSYPGEWKLLIDSLQRKAYVGKVAGLVGVSEGQFGGARAVEAATLLLCGRGMQVMTDTLHFSRVQTHFDASGNLLQGEQQQKVEIFLDTFLKTVSKSY